MENNKELPAEGSSRFVQHTEGRTAHSWSRAGFPGRPKTPPCPKGYPPSAARCEAPSLSLQRRYRSLTLVCAFSYTSPWQPPSSQLGLPPAGNRVRRARRTPRCKSRVSACTGSELTPRLVPGPTRLPRRFAVGRGPGAAQGAGCFSLQVWFFVCTLLEPKNGHQTLPLGFKRCPLSLKALLFLPAERF